MAAEPVPSRPAAPQIQPTWRGSLPEANTDGMFTKHFHLWRLDPTSNRYVECTHRVVAREDRVAALLHGIPAGVEHTEYVLIKELVVEVCRRVGRNTPQYTPDLMKLEPATPEHPARYRLLLREEMAEMAGTVAKRPAKRARV